MGTWWENETILQQVRDLLADAEERIRELDDGAVLVDPETPADGELPEVGLLQLVEAFTALRQELKLQTKSSRGLESTVQEAVGGLERAIRQFETAEARGSQASDAMLEPLLKTFVELDEAFQRALGAFESAKKRAVMETGDRLISDLEGEFATLSFWQRMWARHWQRRVLRVCRERSVEWLDRSLEPLDDGLKLVALRLQRLLEQQGVARIACVGRRVDPTRMNVVEILDDPSLDGETVVEELRPGYTWRDRMLRFAEVRAVRAAKPPCSPE